MSELRLPGLDVFHFLTEDGQVELESVTGDHESGYFLSLQLIAVEGGADFEPLPPINTDAPPTKKRWLRRQRHGRSGPGRSRRDDSRLMPTSQRRPTGRVRARWMSSSISCG